MIADIFESFFHGSNFICSSTSCNIFRYFCCFNQYNFCCFLCFSIIITKISSTWLFTNTLSFEFCWITGVICILYYIYTYIYYIYIYIYIHIYKFKEIDFKIEIETNLKIVNFLDVTFSLANSTYRPYRKPNDNLLYIHTSSNQPPQIIKHLPDSIEEKLSNNSSNEQVFNSAKPEYDKALKDSGYKNVNLKCRARKEQREKNNRNRKTIWFNPPV